MEEQENFWKTTSEEESEAIAAAIAKDIKSGNTGDGDYINKNSTFAESIEIISKFMVTILQIENDDDYDYLYDLSDAQKQQYYSDFEQKLQTVLPALMRDFSELAIKYDLPPNLEFDRFVCTLYNVFSAAPIDWRKLFDYIKNNLNNSENPNS